MYTVSDVQGRKAARNDRESPVFEFDSTPLVRIPVNNGAISDIDISRDGRRLIVANYGADTVSVIDTDARRVVGTVTGLGEPFAVAMSSADAGPAYVSAVSTAYDSIEVVDVATGTRIASHHLALTVSDLTVGASGKHIYASRNGARGADVAIVDTATGQVETIPLATGPGNTTHCLRIGPDEHRLYVGTTGPSGGHLVVIETPTRHHDPRMGGRSRVVGTLELGLPVRDVALADDGGTAYVASCGPVVGAVLDVVDTRTHRIANTRKIVEIPGPLTRLTLSGDGSRAYLVSDDRITVLCTRTLDVVGEVRVAKHPSCAVESPDGRYLYIADYSGVVTVAPLAPTTARAAAAPEGGNGWTVPGPPPGRHALV